MAYDCDIIIVGAGPVGLFLAAELGMRGLSVKVFDDKAGTCTHPAANANSARTMEHFRRLGISKEVRSPGCQATTPRMSRITRACRNTNSHDSHSQVPTMPSQRSGITEFVAHNELLHRCSAEISALLNAISN